MSKTPRSGAILLMAPALFIAAALTFATPASAIFLSSGNASMTGGPTLVDAENYVRSGSWNDAIAVLKTVLDAEPRNADALNLMGYSLRRSGDVQNAEAFYIKALQIQPTHRGANEYLGELYVQVGRLDKARERLDALEAICGTSCEEYRELKAQWTARAEPAVQEVGASSSPYLTRKLPAVFTSSSRFLRCAHLIT